MQQMNMGRGSSGAERDEVGIKPEELNQLDEAIAGKDASEKARLAYQVAPRSVVVDGQNPFKIVFDALGDAIHRGSEDEATAEAQRVAASLDFVIRDLAGHVKNRAAFVEQMRRK